VRGYTKWRERDGEVGQQTEWACWGGMGAIVHIVILPDELCCQFMIDTGLITLDCFSGAGNYRMPESSTVHLRISTAPIPVVLIPPF
jgi:hypothetical protein